MRFLTVILVPVLSTLAVGPLVVLFFVWLPRNLQTYHTSPEECCGLHNYEDIFIKNEDSTTLHGWYFPSQVYKDTEERREVKYNSSNSDATVVVVHGHGGNMAKYTGTEKSILEKAVVPFHHAGFNVLAIELRNHGGSDYRPTTFGRDESSDILTAVDWITERCQSADSRCSPNRVAVWGESMGGSASLLAASRRSHKKSIKAVLVDSPFASFKQTSPFWFARKTGMHIPKEIMQYFEFWFDTVTPFSLSELEIFTFVDQITCPVFLVHGRTDDLVSFNQAELLESSFNVRSAESEFSVYYHELGHVRAYEKEMYFTKMVEFFERHV